MDGNTLTLNAIGGLCNRLRAIASCVNLANVSGRNLEIIWYNNSELKANFLDLFTQLPNNIRLLEPTNLEYALKWEMPRKRNLFISSIFQKFNFSKVYSDSSTLKEFIDRDEDFKNEIINADGKILIISGQANGGFSETEFRQLFKPSKQVHDLIKEKTAGFNASTVGVHIRRTDNLISINSSPTGLFIAEMERRIDHDPNTNFFVATDSPSVMSELISRFGNRIICGDKKASRSTIKGMLHGTADLWALSMTKEIIGSFYSSYTDTAALIGNIPLCILTRKATL